MDLNTLTPDQLLTLKAQLDALSAGAGRSPFKPRQLDDLTLLPTKDDPRPTFFWSAEKPRNGGDLSRTEPYPRLMWHGTNGKEITVSDASAEATMTAKGFILTRPDNAEGPDLAAQLRVQLEALSPEDRAMLVKAAQADRLAKIQEQMAGLSEAELAALTASLGLEPAKRGPGRPRKEQEVA
jgi:hypothetical protein